MFLWYNCDPCWCKTTITTEVLKHQAGKPERNKHIHISSFASANVYCLFTLADKTVFVSGNMSNSIISRYFQQWQQFKDKKTKNTWCKVYYYFIVRRYS